MRRAVIDTDIFIDYLRGHVKSKSFFDNVKSRKFLAYFSAITEAEIISGKECKDTSRKQHAIELLSLATKISVNNEIALKAGDFRRESDVTIGDAIIAATAFYAKANIITRNLSDFKRIKGITAKAPY